MVEFLRAFEGMKRLVRCMKTHGYGSAPLLDPGEHPAKASLNDCQRKVIIPRER